MKKGTKILTGALALTSAAAIIGVGYSAWVVNAKQETATTNIKTEVADVIDNRFTLTASLDENAKPIKFDSQDENLSFKVKYNIELNDAEAEIKDIINPVSYTLTVDEDHDKAFKTCIENQLLDITTLGQAEDVNQNGEFTITFNWGSAFENENPSELLTSPENKDVDNIVKNLNTLKNLNEAIFTVTVTASPKNVN